MSAAAEVTVVEVPADDRLGLHETRALIDEYVRDLGVDLEFQGFSEEMSRFPEAYLAPDGALLLARLHDDPVGCVALRRLDESTCEMKRLYVRPYGRGHGIGRRLVEAMLQRAGTLRYRAVRLDTIARMHAAQALYRALGFRDIPAYYSNPLPGTVYMELALR